MRDRMKNVKSYAVYYGSGNVEKLKQYDMVIIEPSAHIKEEINMLHDAGTIVLAYVSVMEIQSFNPYYNLLRGDDFLSLSGNRIHNEEYSTTLLDIRSKRWSRILIHHIGNLLINENYDGIFLDTIGDIEYESIPTELQNSLIIGAVNFIQDIRYRFKDCIIVQNNGINSLYAYTSNLVDGICWENPPLTKKQSNRYTNEIFKWIEIICYENKVKILILIQLGKENNNTEAAEITNAVMRISKKYNYLYFFACCDYLNIK